MREDAVQKQHESACGRARRAYGISALHLVRETIVYARELEETRGSTAADAELSGISTGQICCDFIKPSTVPFQLCVTDAFHLDLEQCGSASVFVSHAWGAPWLSLVQAVVMNQLRLGEGGEDAAGNAFEAASLRKPTDQLAALEDALLKRAQQLERRSTIRSSGGCTGESTTSSTRSKTSSASRASAFSRKSDHQGDTTS